MSGIFGRAKKRTSVYHNTVKNALGPSPEFTELSRNRVRSSSEIVGQATSRKGEHTIKDIGELEFCNIH
jgi:hypothetical protein